LTASQGVLAADCQTSAGDVMTVQLDPRKMQATLDKNQATSFGLTLVIGLPFPQPIVDRATQTQAQTEAALPGRFHWYAPDHLHATIVAPLRGRYRQGPPLRRTELPDDLDGFAAAMSRCFAEMQPFALELDRLILASNGLVLAVGPDPEGVRHQVAQCLARFPELDQPKDPAGWHVTLGYLATPEPFVSEAEGLRFQAAWSELQVAWSPYSVEVDRAWLVHYGNRILSDVIGRLPLWLGRPTGLSAGQLLTDLQID
jgi:2'-5' RNA ligase